MSKTNNYGIPIGNNSLKPSPFLDGFSRHAELLGYICVQSSWIDSELKRLISLLERFAGEPSHAILVKNRIKQPASKTIKRASRLVSTIDLGRRWNEEIVGLLEELNGLLAQRNRYAHDLWLKQNGRFVKEQLLAHNSGQVVNVEIGQITEGFTLKEARQVYPTEVCSEELEEFVFRLWEGQLMLSRKIGQLKEWLISFKRKRWD